MSVALSSSYPAPRRRVSLVVAVVLLHIGLLWAMQSGLMQRAVDLVVPGQLLSEFIQAPVSPSVHPPAPQKAPLLRSVSVTTAPRITADEPTPTPVAAAPSTAQAQPMEASTATPTPPAPARIELPSNDAAYLNNPRPAYPALSRRLREQGRVRIHVLIGVDGRAQQAEISTSSGFDRLDQAALNTVLGWRYRPGTRNGVAEAMWFYVPINFVLE